MPHILKQDHIFALSRLAGDALIAQNHRTEIIETIGYLRDITPLQFHDVADALPDAPNKLVLAATDAGNFVVCFYLDGCFINAHGTGKYSEKIKSWAYLPKVPSPQIKLQQEECAA